MKYISTKKISSYLSNKRYTSCSTTGSLKSKNIMDITMKKKVDKTVIVYCKSGKMTLNIQDCNTYHSNNPIPHNERLYKFFDKCGNIRNDGYVVSYTQTDLVSKVGTGAQWFQYLKDANIEFQNKKKNWKQY